LLIGVGSLFIVVERSARLFIGFSPDKGSWFVIVIRFGLWIIVIVVEIWRWLRHLLISVSGWFVIVKSDSWLFVVFRPCDSGWLVGSVCLGSFIEEIVVLRWRWTGSIFVVSSFSVILIKIYQWLFVVSSPRHLRDGRWSFCIASLSDGGRR
jgi:hypothetical protein